MYLLYATSACLDADCFFSPPEYIGSAACIFYFFCHVMNISIDFCSFEAAAACAPLNKQMSPSFTTKNKRHAQQAVRWKSCANQDIRNDITSTSDLQNMTRSIGTVAGSQMRPYERHTHSFPTCFVWFIRTRSVWAKNPKGDAFWKIDLLDSKHATHTLKGGPEFNPQFFEIQNKDLQSALRTEIDLSIQSIFGCHW